MVINEVVRVATNNNFNCTAAEFKQLEMFKYLNPQSLFFVNCNVRTPRLPELFHSTSRAVITLNPDLTVDPDLVKRGLWMGDTVSFYRVKWLPFNPAIIDLVIQAAAVAPVVITAQRFNSWDTLEKYTDRKHYKIDCAKLRLHGAALRDLKRFADGISKATAHRVYICDRRDLGCQGCGLCATLNGAPRGTPVKSLNLSCSGVCPYSCPDCYAKTMQRFLTGTGKAPMVYDKIKANKKQAGKTKHIQNHLKRKAA